LNNISKGDNISSSIISLDFDHSDVRKMNIDINDFNSRSIVDLSSRNEEIARSLCKISNNEEYKDASI